MQVLLRIGVLAVGLWLSACGGGDSSTSTLTGPGLSADGLSPAVATVFTQTSNNMRLTVEDVPSLRPALTNPNTNLLYADVRVCNPSDPSKCATIDHVLVDTGSVGLRVLASKVAGLDLPPLNLSKHVGESAWECFAFVIGGLWGRNAVADVWLGQQRTTSPGIPIQLIEDLGASAVPPPQDCINAVGGSPESILMSASRLGANGVLGVGSTPFDCGDICISGDYLAAGAHIQYYRCPPLTSSATQCSGASLVSNELVYNPIAALPDPFNKGLVIKMPSVPTPGAVTASGELILGVNSVLPALGNYSDNQVPGNAAVAELGVDFQTPALLDSYLNVTTEFQGRSYVYSYLDTGTNGIFFNHPSLSPFISSVWYFPTNPTTLDLSADILDGKPTPTHPKANIRFKVGNSMSYTLNAAISDNVGPAPPDPQPDPSIVGAVPHPIAEISFAWGLPFFYGRQVYLSIWDFDAANPPWYAWAPL